MILKGVGRGGTVATKLKRQFLILLRSILQHSKSNPIHFVILTDVQSPEAIVPIFTRYIVRYAKVKVEYDFFDCSAIAQTFTSKIKDNIVENLIVFNKGKTIVHFHNGMYHSKSDINS